MSKQAQATVASGSVRSRRSSKQLRETLDAYSMLLPTIIGVAIFFAIPLGISLYLSFTNARLFGDTKIIGFENYLKALSDATFWIALRNTFVFSLFTLILSTVPALIVAILLNEKIIGRSFFRVLFFIPVVASVVGVSLLWRYLLNLDFGFVNYAIHLLGFEPIPWLTRPEWGLASVILIFTWKTVGYNMVIFLAGLQGVPRQLYEAASLDGASRWRQFLNITLPILSPTTFFVLVTTLINCLQIFDVPVALGLTRGNTVGPADSMLTVVPLLYREAFLNTRMGYASALAWILFLIIMAISFVQFRVSDRWVNYE
ncbi:sugar ABC transporter permease [Oscillochloris sp. ZM17-4]|uniref:carbohydrate ABC transporter permease n=1 Tax=Oscillochloris sp. ZM17-4 TaxID=2866714 RepID=UPI001C72EFBD|nr:sugar ABC transporter permease [Oscillochloris sp. ZM17-4]MBX0327466.1 sugar ABC transporter permease [Oscillochloris sp. ZM17-4]